MRNNLSGSCNLIESILSIPDPPVADDSVVTVIEVTLSILDGDVNDLSAFTLNFYL